MENTKNPLTFSQITKRTRKGFFLLQVGTFLEYFDLMLYVHMVRTLNQVFFPPLSHGDIEEFLVSFSFCMTFIFAPLGALFLGRIADSFGRRHIIMITTIMMAGTSFMITILPSYAEGGIMATFLFLIYRIVQGLSSLGEIITAEIYLTETTRPPARYFFVPLLGTTAMLGGLAALGAVTLVLTCGLGWRWPFLLGCVLALVGRTLRRSLVETRPFLQHLRNQREKRCSLDPQEVSGQNIDGDGLAKKPLQKIFSSTQLAFFVRFCAAPLAFYFSYIYCGGVLKNTFGYTVAQIASHNFWFAFFNVGVYGAYLVLAYYVNPLRLVKTNLMFYGIFLAFLPFCLTHATSPFHVFLIQSASLLLHDFASGILYTHLPVQKRTTQSMVIFSLARIFVYILTSFGLLSLTALFGYQGLWIILAPFVGIYGWAIHHFEQLERGALLSPTFKKSIPGANS